MKSLRDTLLEVFEGSLEARSNFHPPIAMTPLLDALLELLEGWRTVLPQNRTFARAMRVALAQMLAPGCRTISRITAVPRQSHLWPALHPIHSVAAALSKSGG